MVTKYNLRNVSTMSLWRFWCVDVPGHECVSIRVHGRDSGQTHNIHDDDGLHKVCSVLVMRIGPVHHEIERISKTVTQRRDGRTFNERFLVIRMLKKV
jgi:hypothetical protein